MKIAIDAVGIRGHGGAAILCELLHWLPSVRPDWKWHVFLLARRFREFDLPDVVDSVTIEETEFGNSDIGRLQWVRSHLQKKLKMIQADVLLSFANIAPTHAVIPQVMFCHQANAFCSSELRRFPLFSRLRLLFMRLQILKGARACCSVIVQTEQMRKYMLACCPALKGKICVIPSGYRTPSSHPQLNQKVVEAIEQSSHPRLVYITHPGNSKNHLSLIRAMPDCLKKFPEATLLLSLERRREGFPQYAVFVDELVAEAERLGVADRVTLLGILNADEVDYTLRSSDLLVFPSLSESMGLGLVEAMATGCLIAAADLPYAHDVCGDAAVYFDPHRPDNIAEMVIRVCSDAALRARLNAVGKERKERFSYREIANDFAEVFEKAVG